jgi:hypothetical protein
MTYQTGNDIARAKYGPVDGATIAHKIRSKKQELTSEWKSF